MVQVVFDIPRVNLAPGLYIVSTPIGNLSDITLRALSTLKHSDYILCEDTRITQRLLNHYDISVPLLVYNDYSNLQTRQEVTERITQGKVLSLVSDAGTPVISDPGYKLIEHLRELKCHFEVIPGPSAPIAALVMSNLPADCFFFGGFLPRSIGAKRKYLQEIQNLTATLVFFESPHRLLESLQVIQEVLGNRKAAVARELTKVYQEVRVQPLDIIIEHYNNNPARGEIVICINGYQPGGKTVDLDQLIAHDIKDLIGKALSTLDIVNNIKEHYPEISRRVIYELVIKLKQSQA